MTPITHQGERPGSHSSSPADGPASSRLLRAPERGEDGRSTAPSNTVFFAALLPVYLLVIVASTQIYFATTAHLTPWRGGGFGMFAVSDDPGRIVIARALTDAGATIRLRTAPSARLLRFPTDKLVQAMARDLLESPWALEDSTARVYRPAAKGQSSPAVSLVSVTVAVVAITYDARTHLATRDTLVVARASN